MASIKHLKKDVDYLAGAVVSDCINYALYTKKNEDAVAELVNEVVEVRNDIRTRITAGKQVAKAERKAYYKAISSDLMTKTDACFSKLSEMAKA